MKRIEMSGALGAEHPEGTPEGFRLIRLQQSPFELYEIPVPKELAHHLANLLSLPDDELAELLETEERRAKAKAKLATAPTGFNSNP